VNVTRVTECRLCDSPDLDLVVSFTPTPPGDQYRTADKWNEPQPSYPLDVMSCRACGAVQLADTVDPTLIYTDYLYTTSVSRGLSHHFRQYAADVVKRQKRFGSLVVDIGSNDGTLLKAFQSYGCSVHGVEPADRIAKMAIANGIPTSSMFFSREAAVALRANVGPAEIITANHIMANVADLHDFIKGVKHLLAPDGTFVFETGYWPAIVERNLIDTIEHEHIHYFAVKPLQKCFARHELQLVHAELNEAKGGSLRGYVQHAGHPAEVTTQGDMMPTVLLDTWVSDLKDLEQRMKAIIDASACEVWVGYGAAVGSTLLLHQFGLGEKLLCLADANPQKQGRLSPGYNLRVVDPSELRAINPDRIVILAWRYAEMIQQQHPEFAGKWLIPLPQTVCA